VVADKTVAKLESIASKTTLSQIGHEDEVPDAALAQWWLEYGISRKETKRNCMTFLSVGAGDQIGGSHVNLTYAEKPSDIYQVVADKTVEKLVEGRKQSLTENGQEDEVSDAALAQWWLDFGITRKISKRNCMTFLSVGADKTVAKLEEGVKNKPMAETLQEDEVTDAAFAQWWLDYGITRKITKRPIISPRS
jgi:hypothetical protein